MSSSVVEVQEFISMAELVCCVDFGTCNDPFEPRSISFRHVKLQEKDEIDPNDDEVFEHDGQKTDPAVIITKVLKRYENLGAGFVCTGNIMEKKFLQETCGLKAVFSTDEERLRNKIYETCEKFIILPCPSALEKPKSNAGQRSWRLARMLEFYKKNFFENVTNEHLKDVLKLGSFSV